MPFAVSVEGSFSVGVTYSCLRPQLPPFLDYRSKSRRKGTSKEKISPPCVTQKGKKRKNKTTGPGRKADGNPENLRTTKKRTTNNRKDVRRTPDLRGVIGDPDLDLYSGSGGGKEHTSGHKARRELYDAVRFIYYRSKDNPSPNKAKESIAMVVYNHLTTVQGRKWILYDKENELPLVGDDARLGALHIIKQGLRDAMKDVPKKDGTYLVTREQLTASQESLNQYVHDITQKETLDSVSLGDGNEYDPRFTAEEFELAEAASRWSLSRQSVDRRGGDAKTESIRLATSSFEPTQLGTTTTSGLGFGPVPQTRVTPMLNTSPTASPGGGSFSPSLFSWKTSFSPSEFRSGGPLQQRSSMDPDDLEVMLANNIFRPVPAARIYGRDGDDTVETGRDSPSDFRTPQIMAQSFPKEVTPR